MAWGFVAELASKLYLAGLHLHRALTTATSIPNVYKTISVGNIAVGGTGKTPVVEYFARECSKRNGIPLILSRGYGNDERYQYKLNCPECTMIGICANRVEGAKRVLKSHGCGTNNKEKIFAILDDGFQTWHVRRDENIVCVSCLNPWSNGHTLPLGKLREPISALKRATRIILTNSDMVSTQQVDSIQRQIFQAVGHENVLFSKGNMTPAYFLERPSELLAFDSKNKRLCQTSTVQIGSFSFERLELHHLHLPEEIVPVSGIEDPRPFHKLLDDLGFNLSQHGCAARLGVFQDHHTFSRKDIDRIFGLGKRVVTTQKDACRMAHHENSSLSSFFFERLDPLILVSKMELSNGGELWADDLFS